MRTIPIPPSGPTNGCVSNSRATTVSLSRCNNENEWYQIHENIIRKSNTKYSAPSTNYGKYVLPLASGFDLLLFSHLVRIYKDKADNICYYLGPRSLASSSLAVWNSE